VSVATQKSPLVAIVRLLVRGQMGQFLLPEEQVLPVSARPSRGRGLGNRRQVLHEWGPLAGHQWGFLHGHVQKGEGVQNVSIEHNAHIKGDKLGVHQIDVYWRFTVAGIEHQVCVQCKDWKTKVKAKDVFTFTGVLADIPGQPRGLMVAKTGFQKGAMEIGKKSGLILYTLREPLIDADWDGLIRQIHITIHALVPQVEGVTVELDENWIKAQKTRLGISLNELIKINFISETDPYWTCDENGTPLQTGHDIISSIFRTFKSTETSQEVRYEFPENTYIFVEGDARFPYLKIKSLVANIWHITHTSAVTTPKADSITSYILTDVLAGSKVAINRDLEMIERPRPNQNTI